MLGVFIAKYGNELNLKLFVLGQRLVNRKLPPQEDSSQIEFPAACQTRLKKNRNFVSTFFSTTSRTSWLLPEICYRFCDKLNEKGLMDWVPDPPALFFAKKRVFPFHQRSALFSGHQKIVSNACHNQGGDSKALPQKQNFCSHHRGKDARIPG